MTTELLKRLGDTADQFISHSAAQHIEQIEAAGELMREAHVALSQPASEDAWLDSALDKLDTYTQGCQQSGTLMFAAKRELLDHLRARPAPEGFVLVPVVPTKAMNQVMYDGDWTWPDLLAAAESITEDEYNTLNTMLNAAKESGK